MNLSRSRYIKTKPIIESWIERHPDQNAESKIAELSIDTCCHVIIVCIFVGEIQGFTPNLKRIIDINMEFYKIEEIIE